MIDVRGYRLNVGIVLANDEGRLFLGKRIGQDDAWQFPQGGLNNYETLQEAMYRELSEELGLTAADVEVLGMSRRWLYYQLPQRFRRPSHQVCIGQKQRWFLLRLRTDEQKICFTLTDSPEFDSWRWVEYWEPLTRVIVFKRQVYEQVLQEFKPLLPITYK